MWFSLLSRWTRTIPGTATAGVVSTALMAAGCDFSDSLRTIGLIDSAPPGSARVTVLLDASAGSGTTPDAYRQTLDLVLAELAGRPGSGLSVWELGEDVARTRLLGTRTSPALPSATGRRRLAEARFRAAASEYLDKAAEPVFASAPKRRSPIAEGVSRIALSRSLRRAPELLVLLSDGREVSDFADFECGTLPTPEAFRRKLQGAQVLAPGSLVGTTVVFAGVTLGPVVGRPCQITLARARAIEQLWTEVLSSAGAGSVRFLYGPLTADLLSACLPTTPPRRT